MEGRRRICELFNDAEASNRTAASVGSPDFMVGDVSKRHREAWILGKFAQVYNRLPGAVALEYAIRGETVEIPADFAVFSAADDASYVCDIEIFEMLDRGRRRDAEYRDRSTSVRHVKDSGSNAREILMRKLQVKGRRYRQPTWMLAYRNVGSDLLREDGWRHAIADVQHVVRAIAVPGGIAQIWLLRSDGSAVCQIYP